MCTIAVPYPYLWQFLQPQFHNLLSLGSIWLAELCTQCQTLLQWTAPLLKNRPTLKNKPPHFLNKIVAKGAFLRKVSPPIYAVVHTVMASKKYCVRGGTKKWSSLPMGIFSRDYDKLLLVSTIAMQCIWRLFKYLWKPGNDWVYTRKEVWDRQGDVTYKWKIVT